MELCSVLQLGSTKFGSTFESTAALNYSSRPKLQLGSVHVKIDVWTRPKTNSIPAKLFPFYLHSFLCFDTFSYNSVIFDVNEIRWERNHLLPIVFLEIHSRTKMSCTSQPFEKNSFRTERIKQKKKKTLDGKHSDSEIKIEVDWLLSL